VPFWIAEIKLRDVSTVEKRVLIARGSRPIKMKQLVVHVARVATATTSQTRVDLPNVQDFPQNTSSNTLLEDSDKAKQIAASKTGVRADRMELQ
jgi:hypothetical protein